jgi:hypothetical protein
MSEKPCVGDHSRHVCILAFDRKFDEIKAIAKEPKFMCYNCGRVSRSDQDLCNPRPLD